MRLMKLQQWSKRSLANSIALQASIIAIGGGLWVAIISLSVLYWSQSNALHNQMQGKVVRLTERIERTINVAESASSDLAKSSIFTTGILDSTGRNAYLEPFLKNYTLPIPAANGIALCDINGVRLAGTRAGMSDCRADTLQFKQVLKDGKTVRELVPLKNAHLTWIIYHAVALSYTGTVEGVVVTQIDMHDLISSSPEDLDLEKVTLEKADSAEKLLSVGMADTSVSGMASAKSVLFQGSPDSAPFPIEVTIWRHLTIFEKTLLPLVMSYGLGIMLLVIGVMYGTRRLSLRLIAPLSRLTTVAREIAETGNMNMEIPSMKHGELGQLTQAFQIMVDTIRDSEEKLENQVLLRTLQLQSAEASLRSVFDAATGIAIIATDKQGFITLFNPGAERMLGYRAEEVVGKMTLSQYILPEELGAVAGKRIDAKEVSVTGMELLLDHPEVGGSTEKEWTWVRKDSGQLTVRLSITPIYDVNRALSGYLGVAEDITNQKLAETKLRIAAIAFESQEGMFVTDPDSRILQVNRAFTDITGYSPEDAIGKHTRILSSGRHDSTFYAAMRESLSDTGSWEGEVWNRRKNGEVYPEHLTITAVKDHNGKLTNYVAALADITKSKSAEDEIKHLAFFDPLTRLPNRRLLQDRLKQAMASSSRSGKESALLFIDLDNFKTLNDTLGHDIGDLLLQQVAQRLESCVREGDTVARLGGDEFVLMLEGLSEITIEAAEQAESIGNKILVTLNQPYQLGTKEHHSTPSIGATLFNNNKSIDELLKQADIAMYQAKKAGRNTLRFFDPEMQDSINARSSLEAELRNAIEHQQFQLYFQVQMDSLFRPFGAEALIRWIHPERGLISPVDFIPLAEETGLILPVGQWVVNSACTQLKTWEQSEHTRNLVLSVNVSAKQFRQDDFVTQVRTAVNHHAIDPTLLKLELTESMLLENIEDTISTMNALNAIGVRISLDDFGTGYSSLQYLKRLPLHQLKIDQSFVRDITTDSSDKAIVATIIAMAHSLNLDVIAEGVETEGQKQFLLNKGCSHFQGYLFGKPLPIVQFEELLKQGC